MPSICKWIPRRQHSLAKWDSFKLLVILALIAVTLSTEACSEGSVAGLTTFSISLPWSDTSKTENTFTLTTLANPYRLNPLAKLLVGTDSLTISEAGVVSLSLNGAHANEKGIFWTMWQNIRMRVIIVEMGSLLKGGIWVGQAKLHNPNGLLAPRLEGTIFEFLNTAGSAGCGYFDMFPPKYEFDCGPNTKIIPHVYISGFVYESQRSLTLKAKAIIDMTLAFGRGTQGQKYGPSTMVDGFGAKLLYVQLTYVLTIIKHVDTYPYQQQDPQAFTYSGRMVQSAKLNTVIDYLDEATKGGAFAIPSPPTIFYGFSDIQIQSLPNQCFYSIDLTFTQKENFFNVFSTTQSNQIGFSFDAYMKNVGKVCGGLVQHQQRAIDSIDSKAFSSYPVEAPSAQSIVESQDPERPESTSVFMQVYPNTALQREVFFMIMLGFNRIPFGETIVVDIEVKQPPIKNSCADCSILVSALVDDAEILQQTVKPNMDKERELVTKLQAGFNSNNRNPVVTIRLMTVRNPIQPFGFFAAIKLAQLVSIYDASTECCVQLCAANTFLRIDRGFLACMTCNSKIGEVLDLDTGKCRCPSGQYRLRLPTELTGSCYPCQSPLCQTCNPQAPSQCLTCRFSARFSPSTHSCSCYPGFYYSNNQCLFCPRKCLSCSRATICDQCADPTNRLLAKNCACKVGTYDMGSNQCFKCHETCKSCLAEAQCLTCIQGTNRVLVDGTCACKSWFYEAVGPNKLLSCFACSPVCLKCQNTPTYCTSCDNTAGKKLLYDPMYGATCQCMLGYTMNSEGVCIKNGCNMDPYCQQCNINMGRIPTCTKCLASSQRVVAPPFSKCVCGFGSFESNKECVACKPGCIRCTSLFACDQCVQLANSKVGGFCECPTGYYLSIANKTPKCEKCITNCLQCTDGLTCTRCPPNFIMSPEKVCYCDVARVLSVSGECLRCPENCQMCEQNMKCSICIGQYINNRGQCVASCPFGTFLMGTVCQACTTNCLACTDGISCNQCKEGLFALNGECVQACVPGTFLGDGGKCQSCSFPCQTCQNSALACTSCQPNYAISGSNCLLTCPLNSYFDGVKCSSCDASCQNCERSATACTSCPIGKLLFMGKCYDSCPLVAISNKCLAGCPFGQYLTEGACQPCNYDCLNCLETGSTCTKCEPLYVLRGTQCKGRCITKQMQVGDKCIPCDVSCLSCHGAPDNCRECAYGFYRYKSRCVGACLGSTFLNSEKLSCEDCPTTCLTCTAFNQCTTCVEPKNTPINGVCYECVHPCEICSIEKGCERCLIGFIKNGWSCVASCPSDRINVNGVCVCRSDFEYKYECVAICPVGTVAINKVCQVCTPNCISCSAATQKCTACRPGYILNERSQACDLWQGCPFGQNFNRQNIKCETICDYPMFYFNSLCVKECPLNFGPNGFGGCIRQQTQSGCSYPFFLSSGRCAKTCALGTFPNKANRICQYCSTNCLGCFSKNVCYQCQPGWELVDGLCVKLTTPCLNQLVQFKSQCIATCPLGTENNNGYCIGLCDTETYYFNAVCMKTCPKFYTDLACVDSCPIGTKTDGNKCLQSNQSCKDGQYYNPATAVCTKCSSTCLTCQYKDTICTSCLSPMRLYGSSCYPSQSVCPFGKYIEQSTTAKLSVCMPCPERCSTCLTSAICITCSSNYFFNGDNCIRNIRKLVPVYVSLKSISRVSAVTVAIKVSLSAVPGDLTQTQTSEMFQLYSSSENAPLYCNQWPDSRNPNLYTILLTYRLAIPTSAYIYFVLNAMILAQRFAAIGYTANAESYLEIRVTNSLPLALNSSDNAVPDGVANVNTNGLAAINLGQTKLWAIMRTRENLQ